MRFMKSLDWFILLLVLAALGLVAAARSRVDAARTAQMSAELTLLDATIDALEVRCAADPVAIPELELPQWILDAPEARDSIARLATLSERHAGLGSLSLVESDRDELVRRAVDGSILDEIAAAHPGLVERPDEWALGIERRLAVLRSAGERCRIHPFGSDQPVADSTPAAEAALREFRSSESRERRIALGSALALAVDELEFAAATARPMPVINGEARGTIPGRGTLVRFCETPRSPPGTSTLRSRSTGSCGFTLRTRPGDSHVFARLVDRGSEVWRGFVRAGDSLSVDLPPGDYVLRYATGRTWYGFEYLFGPGTSFSEAGDLIDLRYGYRTTIELIPQIDGNLSEREIDANSF